MSLEQKQIWTVGDFAAVMKVSHWQARELLKRLDEEMGGLLLRRSRGNNRQYTFFSAALLKSKPEVLERVRDMSARVATVEERLDEQADLLRRVVAQTGANTREIHQLKKAG